MRKRKRYVNSSFLKFVLENNKEKLKELELEFNEDELNNQEKTDTDTDTENEDEVKDEDELKNDIQDEEDPDIIKELKEYFKKLKSKK